MTITFSAHTLYGLSTDTKPTDVDTNRLFLETDTLQQYLFDGADWNLLPSGGVTGLNPNSTILEHSTDIEDYTTPTDATATSEQPAVSVYDHAGDSGGSFSFLCGSGCDGTRIGILLSTGFSGLGSTVNAIRWRLEKVGTPTGTVTVAIRNSIDAIKASGTFDISTIPTSPSFEEKEVVLSAPVILAQDDRVTVEFSGGDNTNYLLVRKSTDANDTNTSYQLYNGSWANSGANAGAVTFDSGTNSALSAIDGDTATFWRSQAGVNESITLELGGVTNAFGLAYYIDKAISGITETQFQIKGIPTNPPTFEDDFVYASQAAANAVWIPQLDAANSRVNIATENLDWTLDRASVNKNILVDLTTVSDTEFLCRFHWTVPTLSLGSASGKFGAFGFFGSDGTVPFATLQNALFLRVAFSSTPTEDDYRVAEADNENLTSGANTLFTETISAGDDFYMEFIRFDATNFTINFYSDPDYSILVESRALVTGAITGLQYFGVKSNSDAAGTTGSAFGTIDDFLFYDGVTSITATGDPRTLRTVNVSDLVDQSYNFIRFNGDNVEFIQVEGSSGASAIMAANELKVLTEPDPPLTTDHGQFTINGTDDTLPLDGGSPTSFIIEDAMVNSILFNNVLTPNDPEIEKAIMWLETSDADNNALKVKLQNDGTIKTFELAPNGGGITGLKPNSTILEYLTDETLYTIPSAATATSEDGANVAANAIDDNTTTFWKSTAGINESIILDMGSVVNAYGLAYYLSTDAGMTETQFQINLEASAASLFTDDYSSSAGWTIEGSGISINSGVADHAAAINSLGSNEDRAYTGLGGNLSDTEWIAEFDMEVQTTTTTNGSQGILACFTSGTGKINTTTDMIGIRTSQLNGGTSTLAILYKDGAGAITVSSISTAFATGTQKWLTFKRTSATSVVLEIYDDIDRTSLFDTVTQNSLPATVTGLDTIQHSFEGTGTDRIYWQIDSIVVYNNTTVIPTPVVGRTLRTVNTSDLILDAWNFIRFNGANAQVIGIRGSSGNSLVMAANELRVQIEEDPPLTTLHGQFTINPTDPALPLNGGDPTSSVIDDPQINTLTLNNVATPNNPETGKAVLWVETVDADNDGVFAKIKVDGTFKTVRVI